MTEEFCIVETEYGKVRGVKVISEVEIPYWRFLGIPYAKPPFGELKFKVICKKIIYKNFKKLIANYNFYNLECHQTFLMGRSFRCSY